MIGMYGGYDNLTFLVSIINVVNINFNNSETTCANRLI